MKSPKKYNSTLIAAIGTALVHLLLFGVLSYNFTGEGDSSQLSDADLEQLELNMEDFNPEDMDMTAPGKDPLTDKSDKASESISKDNGPAKTSQSATATPEPETEEIREVVTVDSLVPKKKDVAELLKKDTVKIIPNDSALIAQIVRPSKNSVVNEANRQKRQTEKEKFEFYKKNYKNIRNFKKVYPYALKTREIIENLNAQLAVMTSESEKRKLISKTEKMLFDEYEAAVRTMSTSQGKLLLKLIARETNKTGYDIIKEYKGAFSASFWYGVGKIFGTDLKTEFNKAQEDSLLENIVDKYKNDELY